MALEDQIRSALADRDRRSSGVPTPTLTEIEAAASADVRLVPDDEGAGAGAGVVGAGSVGRGPRRVQVAVAAAVALVLAIAGVVVLGDRGDEDAVVAGPGAESDVTWRDAPLLAPHDADWYVTRWDPNLPPPDVVPARWPVSGLVFVSHDVAWGLGVSYVAGDAGPAVNATGEQRISAEEVDLAGRRVTVYELSSAAPLGSGLPSSVSTTVAWRQGSFEVTLDGSIGATTGVVGDTPVTNEVPPEPARIASEVIEAVVASIQPVPFESWSAALQPAYGVPAPDVSADSGAGVSSSPFFVGDTVRPLRIGAPEEVASSKLWVAPWTGSWTTLRQTSTGEPLALEVTTRQHSSTGGNLVGVDGTSVPIDVRGTRGVRATRGGGVFVAPLYGGDEPRTADKSITWNESGSEVSLLYPAEVSDDEALALANSLVILDDAPWEALLFPGGDAVDDSSTAEGSDLSVLDWGTSAAVEDVFSFEAPRGVEWEIVDYRPPLMGVGGAVTSATYGYTVHFEHLGRSWSLLVSSDPSEVVSSLWSTRSVVIDGRSVALVDAEDGSAGLFAAIVEGDSDRRFRLQGSSEVPTPDGSALLAQSATEDEYRAVVALLESVAVEEWEAKLLAGVISPSSVLLPRQTDLAVLSLSASRAANEADTVSGGFETSLGPGVPFALQVASVPAVRSAQTQAIRLRGRDATVVSAPFDGKIVIGSLLSDPTSRVELDRALVWEEGDVTVTLLFPSTLSTDTAIELAESFVHPTPEEWRRLLGF